jgi:hypothetical protein
MDSARTALKMSPGWEFALEIGDSNRTETIVPAGISSILKEADGDLPPRSADRSKGR